MYHLIFKFLNILIIANNKNHAKLISVLTAQTKILNSSLNPGLLNPTADFCRVVTFKRKFEECVWV